MTAQPMPLRGLWYAPGARTAADAAVSFPYSMAGIRISDYVVARCLALSDGGAYLQVMRRWCRPVSSRVMAVT
ncbi:hypothetical protein GCM10009780_05680 [Actinomadura alba]